MPSIVPALVSALRRGAGEDEATMDSGGRDVSDMALKGTSVTAAEAASRSAVLKRLRLTDTVFHGLTRTAAFTVLALLSGVIIALVIGAAPALGTFGFGFLFDESWNPVTERFGALAPIYGTLVTSAIAMLIAVPVGLMIAFFLTELCPPGAAPADRHRHRAAGRHPQHHLRHLGPVRVRAVPADSTSSPS